MIQREKLILLRKEKGLTQMQVAEEIKVSRQAISGWETGTVVPSLENLKSLSALYEVSVDHLLNNENERFPVGTTEEKEEPRKLKKRAIIILVLIGILLVCIGFSLFANGDSLHGENKQMDSANVDEPVWEEQDLSRKGVLK